MIWLQIGAFVCFVAVIGEGEARGIQLLAICTNLSSAMLGKVLLHFFIYFAFLLICIYSLYCVLKVTYRVYSDHTDALF